jgi:hypothetical protein
VSTVDRFYWSNRSSVIMSDLPAESRVHPQLFGLLTFRVPDVEEMMKDTLLAPDDAGALPTL